MAKYPIRSEFFPYNRFTPPISRPFLALARRFMGVPRFLWRDPALQVSRHSIPAQDGTPLQAYLLTPAGLDTSTPLLINYHGGGFVLEGGPSHWHLAMAYAKQARCKVLYVRYRLAPQHPFPTPQLDCFAALQWALAHADLLGIDPRRIGLAGDSAGGTLTAVVCQMARAENLAPQPRFQLLVYPWLYDGNDSPSRLRYVDTPMWNTRLGDRIGPWIDPHPETFPLAWRSPLQAGDLHGLPPAYIEVAEFDCLHDDGVAYATALRQAGIAVQLHEPQGTMHGFDTKITAPTTQQMIRTRTAYMRAGFDT